MTIQVSVVVATYKRPHLLANCLQALTAQNFPRDTYEVIVVDNAGCEETRAVVEKFSVGKRSQGSRIRSAVTNDAMEGVEVRYLTAVRRRGPAAARNVGWKAARGEVIAFTDDDCLPDRNWLKEGIAVMSKGYDGASGRVVVPVPDRPTDYEKNISRLETDSEFVTANCFYRCDVLAMCGGFDPRFEMAWREDSDLFFQSLENSFRMTSAPRAVVVHPVRQAPWGVSLKEERKNMYNALLYKKHPQLYRERIQSPPPIRYYVIVLSFFVGVAAAVIGNWLMATTLMFLWAVLTVHFALQRLQKTRLSFSHVLEMFYTSVLIPPLSIFWRLYGAFTYRVWFF